MVTGGGEEKRDFGALSKCLRYKSPLSDSTNLIATFAVVTKTPTSTRWHVKNLSVEFGTRGRKTKNLFMERILF